MTKARKKKPTWLSFFVIISPLVALLFASASFALTVTSELPPDGEVDLAYNFDLQISGGTPPYNVTVTKCCLPPGLDIDSSSISGTPTLPKTARFTITVTDNAGATLTRTFRIKILKALAITTASLKAGKVGKKYAGALKVTGGKKPYSWSVVSGALPAGVSFDAATGKLAGIPTEGGSTDVTFQATDNLGAIHQASFTIAGIGPPHPPPPQLPPLSDDLAPRFRGATLGEWGDGWADPKYRGWQNIDEFPRWGGNILSVLFSPYMFGEPILPGELLAKRVNAVLDNYNAVIDWALQHNVYVILRFHQVQRYPRKPLRIWPDDERALWSDASAQDELVQAWVDLAKRFKGKKGILFNLLTEPFWWKKEVSTPQMVQIWNVLYPRLVQAIRAEDPDRWIVVEPALDYNYFGDLVVSKDPKVMYEFHHYDHEFTSQGSDFIDSPPGSVVYPGWITELGTGETVFLDKSLIEHRLRHAIEFRDKNKVRMIAGEIGSSYLAPMDSRVRWTADVIDLLEQYGFDWAYFTYDAMNWAELNDFGPWDFESTPIEPVVTSKYALNLPP